MEHTLPASISTVELGSNPDDLGHAKVSLLVRWFDSRSCIVHVFGAAKIDVSLIKVFSIQGVLIKGSHSIALSTQIPAYSTSQAVSS